MQEGGRTLRIAAIWRVVRGAVVDTEAGREADASLEAVLLDERAGAVLDGLRDVDHAHAGLDDLARVLPYLPVHLGALADVVVRLLGILHDHALIISHLFARCSPSIAASGVSYVTTSMEESATYSSL